jgi:hypothetical protein
MAMSISDMKDLVDNVCGPVVYRDKYGVDIYERLSYVNINRKHPLFQEDLPEGEIYDVSKMNALRVLLKTTATAMADGCDDLEWKQIFLHKAAVMLPKQDYLDASNPA